MSARWTHIALAALVGLVAQCRPPLLQDDTYSCDPAVAGACPNGFQCRYSTAGDDYRCMRGTTSCGNGRCDPGETSESCPADCYCGNGVREGEEQCDGLDLGGATCVILGYLRGTLACQGTCQFDLSQCSGTRCGNGFVEMGEQCDDGNTTGGDGCSAACQVEPGWACSGQPSECAFTCGNGVLDLGEYCDGDLLRDASCLTLGYWGGELGCEETCRYDVSACLGNPCGNGILDPEEACDGTHFGDQSCITQGFIGGLLTCTAECGIDTSQCTSYVCGNGIIEGSEQCDATALGGFTCQSLGFVAGTLACEADCSYDTSGCTRCGNGILDPGEECDDGNTTGGDGCSSTCQYETICSANATITCGEMVSQSNMMLATNQVEGYSCGNETGEAGDRIYSFLAPATGDATLFLDVQVTGLFGDDLDLYVLEGSCHPGNCIGASETAGDDHLVGLVTAGKTYFVVVEVYAMPITGGSGAFTLTLTCP